MALEAWNFEEYQKKFDTSKSVVNQLSNVLDGKLDVWEISPENEEKLTDKIISHINRIENLARMVYNDASDKWKEALNSLISNFFSLLSWSLEEVKSVDESELALEVDLLMEDINEQGEITKGLESIKLRSDINTYWALSYISYEDFDESSLSIEMQLKRLKSIENYNPFLLISTTEHLEKKLDKANTRESCSTWDEIKLFSQEKHDKYVESIKKMRNKLISTPLNHRQVLALNNKIIELEKQKGEELLKQHLENKWVKKFEQFHDNYSGFSATLSHMESWEKVLSIRWTEVRDINDLAADLLLALWKPPKWQLRSLFETFDAIKQKYPWEKFKVAWHSLGGALAQFLCSEYPDDIADACTFNSPGIKGLLDEKTIAKCDINLLDSELLARCCSKCSEYSWNNLINIVWWEGITLTAALWQRIWTDIFIPRSSEHGIYEITRDVDNMTLEETMKIFDYDVIKRNKLHRKD